MTNQAQPVPDDEGPATRPTDEPTTGEAAVADEAAGGGGTGVPPGPSDGPGTVPGEPGDPGVPPGASGGGVGAPPPDAGGRAGFPPPGGFPPPPPGTAGWATRYGLVRPAQGRVFAGVCSAAGRATNTDPVLWRVLFAVLTLVGGLGLIAYVAGWLFIPAEGDTASPVEALVGRGRSSTSPTFTVLIGALAVVAAVAFLFRDMRSLVILLALVLGAIIVLSRNGKSTGTVPPGGPPGPAFPPGGYAPPSPSTGGFPPPTGYAPAGAGPSAGYSPPVDGPAPTTLPVQPPAAGPLTSTPTGSGAPAFTGTQAFSGANPPSAGATTTGGYRPPFAPHGPYSPPAGAYPYPGLAGPAPAAPPARSPKAAPSRLGRFTLSALLVALGVMAIVDVSGASISALSYLAVAVGVIGAGLLIGTWFGRARWLIPIGLVLTAVLAIGGAVDQWRAPEHVGDTTWRPYTISDLRDRYSSSFGDGTLDLRRIDFTGTDRTVSVKVNVGDLTVRVPQDVDVTVRASNQVGDAQVFDESWSRIGGDVHTVTDDGPDGPGGGHLTLDVTVVVGDLEVSR